MNVLSLGLNCILVFMKRIHSRVGFYYRTRKNHFGCRWLGGEQVDAMQKELQPF
jgi:hypothetical protein